MPRQRFWQWNRYTPVGECNAAMRDGRWKLVRPAIDALMRGDAGGPRRWTSLPKYDPTSTPTSLATPEPERARSRRRRAQLFDLDSDPGETHDLAAAQPERVPRMERELAAWFEEVEAERRRDRRRAVATACRKSCSIASS